MMDSSSNYPFLWLAFTLATGACTEGRDESGLTGFSTLGSEGTGTPGTDAGGSGSGTGLGPGGSSGGIFDVGGGSNETAGDPGECGCGNTDWSYIFVANSGESTVSKIDTRTLVEEGRYITHPEKKGNPSRTSVSLTGESVAVANRSGGVVKIWARPELCDPMRNGVAGLQTSTGPNDVLSWGDDDCVDWFTPFDHGKQRPVAWQGGILNPATCTYAEKVWTAGCDPSTPTAHLLDGVTGSVEESVLLSGLPCDFVGPYGGAVDGDGNFWVMTFGQNDHSLLARVDAVTFDVEVWSAPIPAYGITVDRTGRVWLSANGGEEFLPIAAGAWAARFDPASQSWASAGTGGLGQSGIQEDNQGRMWINYWGQGSAGGLLFIDSETLEVSAPIELPSAGKGVSVDKDGRVWSVAVHGVGSARRYDPATQALDSYDGLTNPYTYSDMTGWALQNAWCKPEG